jgi:hypothetical protein
MEVRVPTSSCKVDANGLAHAGSQRSLQLWVNRNREDLSLRVVDALRGDLPATGSVRWVSPLERSGYEEYHDAGFLRAVGCEQALPQLAEFWPKGGPYWDALAVVEDQALGVDRGVILIEAKSYPGEMFSGGCGASPKSRPRIEAALGTTREWLGVSGAADWTGPLYQHANRLAHLYFLREIVHVPAWLVNIYFVNDRRSPTTQAEWLPALAQARLELGLTGVAPHEADLFLDVVEQLAVFAGRDRPSSERSEVGW